METAIHEEEYKGYKISIYSDDIYEVNEEFTNPEPFHTYGSWNWYTLFETEGRGDAWHQHINDQYNVLPQYVEDYYNNPSPRIRNEEDAQAAIERWIDKNLLVLPVYVYEHSGITMSTGSYSCQFDSGQAGFIYISKKDARKQYGYKKLTKKKELEVYDHMEKRIKYLAAICEGSIYGYLIEKDDETIDSCGGFVETDYPIEKTYVYKEARNTVDYAYTQALKDHIKTKKAQIQNHVPLLAR